MVTLNSGVKRLAETTKKMLARNLTSHGTKRAPVIINKHTDPRE